MVERCVREHRTVGVLCEAVGCELGSMVQCFGIFCQGRFGAENRVTTCLTTCTDLGVKNSIFFDDRGVAQFGRALRSGRRGRVFKSRRLDQKPHYKAF